MSLVYEALQKAEREKGRKTGTPPAPVAVPPVQPVAVAKAPAPAAVPLTTVPAESPKSMNSLLTMLFAGVSVVALLAIVYIVMLAARNFAPSPAARASESVPAAASTPAAAIAPDPANQATGSSGEKPPVPLSPNSTANDPRYRLTGVMITDGHYGAVLNDHVVYDGQYVDGAIVKKVERDRVTLNVDGRDIVIRLF
jgi:hypothetical protein